MANISSVNLDIVNNADGAQLKGGTTKRVLSWTGADITISASALTLGSNAYTLPTAADTLVGRTSTDTLTNKTLTSPVINVTSDATGDIYYRSSGLFTRLGIGSTNQVLTVISGLPSWQPAPTGFTNPMTTLGDIMYENATPAAARLAGNTTTTLQFLSSTGNGSTATAPAWTNFNTSVQANRLDQMAAPTASVSYNSQNLINLATPVNPNDAANKAYVDATAQGLSVKGSARVASTGSNITLSGTQTIDGVSLVIGDRVLLKDQTSASANGIYIVASGAWSRSSDTATSADVTTGIFVFVSEGTVNGGSGWVLTTDETITLGTTSLTFTQFSGAGEISAGTGLTKSGNTLSVATSYAGGSSITTLGTVTTGTWNATAVPILYGGTGQTTASAAFNALYPYTDASGTSLSMAANNGYVADNAALVTLTLPSTCTFGSQIEVLGRGAGGWKVAQNAGQQIFFGNTSTTSGTGGYLASTLARDTIILVCTVANTEFQVISSIGNITYN